MNITFGSLYSYIFINITSFMILFKNVLSSSQFNQQISDSKDNDFDGQLLTPS